MVLDPNNPSNLKSLSADELYWEDVESARRQSPDEKVRAAFGLFELSSEMMKADIRARNPEADEQRVLELLRQRFELGRSLELGHD